MTPKETTKTPVTNSNKMEIYELSDKEFRIALLKKFSELPKNMDRQLNEIRKIMCEQNEFNKEIQITKTQRKN